MSSLSPSSSPVPNKGATASLQCFICGKGEDESKKLCHFGATSVFPTPLTLHTFCGVTSAILPRVNRPDLEILGASQIRYKFGQGTDVQVALRNARKGVIVGSSAANAEDPKTYYLCRDIQYCLQRGFPPLSSPPPVTTNKMEPRHVSPETVDDDALVTLAEAVIEASSPPAKKAKSSSSPPIAPIVPTPASPYAATMERLFQVCERKKATAYRVIRGIAAADYQPLGHDPHECSPSQVDAMRVVLLTPHRSWYLKTMEQQLVDGSNEDFFFFVGTDFAERVVDAWKTVVLPIYVQNIAKGAPAGIQFDMLLAFTLTIHKYNVWMYQHDDNDWTEGETMVRELGYMWKKVLSTKPWTELDMDEEFTYPGVMALLSDFQTNVNFVENMHFDYM